MDPDFAGTGRNGSASRPWQSLADGAPAPWNAINSALATGPVTVYFSAANATHNANQTSVTPITISRNDTSANVLTLDGISQYNTNDTTPSWATNVTPTPANWQAALKFDIHSSVPFDSNDATGCPNRTGITLQGFRLRSTNGQISNGAYIQNFTEQYVEGSRDPGGSGGPGAFIGPGNQGPGCSGVGVPNVTFQFNYFHDTWGECLYIGASQSDPTPVQTTDHITGDNYLVKNNRFENCASQGGQGDGIDVKDGHTNLRLIGNIIRQSISGVAPAGTDGQAIAFESGTLIDGNYIEQTNYTSGTAVTPHDCIAIFEGWNNQIGRTTVDVRNNICVNITGGSGHNAGIDVQSPLTGVTKLWSAVHVYNNSIFKTNDQCVEIESGHVNGLATVENNICHSTAGGGVTGGSMLATHDYNDYFNAGVSCPVSGETHSICGDPKFVSTSTPYVDTNFKLQAGSPAIGAGTNLSSFFTTDYSGATRTVPWDMGAYKF